jgi:hypothetical protein
MTGVSHLKKAEQRLETWEDYTFCRENNGQRFLGFSKCLIHRLSDIPTNAAYYSKLLTDRVKPAFRSKRRFRSVKSVCLLHDNARPHTAAVTTGTLEEMHREVLPHPASSLDLAPSGFHLFGPLKEDLGGKRFRSDNEVKTFVQRWLDEEPQTFLKEA